jgi:F0F1-type ATP synthase membrane subunit c/vacuolar-type H+-ATPase subunit K
MRMNTKIVIGGKLLKLMARNRSIGGKMFIQSLALLKFFWEMVI